MDKLLFLPITKIDEEKRLVYGVAAQEVPDRSRPIPELMDYASSKPNFETWSNEQQEASMGKSYGNVRVMHQHIAAGFLAEPITFDDEQKLIGVCAKISDDQEWQKCLDGTYTGFSMGGHYAPDSKRIEQLNGMTVRRYTAVPSEISLVDRPGIPTATFALVKADGTVEERSFQKIAKRPDVKPSEGEKKYGDVKFADVKNKKYPIDTAAHIRAAWNYINKPKNAAKYAAADVKSIKAKIVAAWKSKIDKDGPPSAKEADVKKLACYTDAMDVLNKWAGEEISDAQSAVYALQSIVYLYEKEMNEEHPEAAAQIKALADAIKALKAFIVSEIQEADEDNVIHLAEMVGELQKLTTGELQKVGAAISTKNMEKVQAIHDHSMAMGAKCTKENCDKADEPGDLQKIEADALQKVQTEVIGPIAEALGVAEGEVVLTKVQTVMGDLSKLQTEHTDALQKLETLTATGTRMEKVIRSALGMGEKDAFDLAKIEAMPAPATAARTETVAVTKAQDGAQLGNEFTEQLNKVADMIKSGNNEGAALELTKAIHSGGGSPLVRQRQTN